MILRSEDPFQVKEWPWQKKGSQRLVEMGSAEDRTDAYGDQDLFQDVRGTNQKCELLKSLSESHARPAHNKNSETSTNLGARFVTLLTSLMAMQFTNTRCWYSFCVFCLLATICTYMCTCVWVQMGYMSILIDIYWYYLKELNQVPWLNCRRVVSRIHTAQSLIRQRINPASSLSRRASSMKDLRYGDSFYHKIGLGPTKKPKQVCSTYVPVSLEEHLAMMATN